MYRPLKIKSLILLNQIQNEYTIQNGQNCSKSVEFDNFPSPFTFQLATDSAAGAPFCFDEKSFLLIGTFTACLHATFQRWKLSLLTSYTQSSSVCYLVKSGRIFYSYCHDFFFLWCYSCIGTELRNKISKKSTWATSWLGLLKITYSEKATKFCEIFLLLLTTYSTYSQK